MVRDLLLKAFAHLGLMAMPAAIADAAHDPRVHAARNRAQLAQAELERATRLARRSIGSGGSSEDIDRRVAEINQARMQIESIVKIHDDDPDSDILRSMDAP